MGARRAPCPFRTLPEVIAQISPHFRSARFSKSCPATVVTGVGLFAPGGALQGLFEDDVRADLLPGVVDLSRELLRVHLCAQ